MRRSQHITLGLLAGMALAFTSGCRPEHRDCVDAADKIANDQNCAAYEQARREGRTANMPYYRYLYGGSSGGHIGDMVWGGNPAPRRNSGGWGGGSGGGHWWGGSSSSSGDTSSGGFFGGISRGGFGGHAGGGA